MSRKIDTSKPITQEEAEYLRQRGRLTDNIEVQQEEDGGYATWNKKRLRRTLKSRELDYSDATKDELIARLEAADAEESDGDDEDEDEE